MKVLLIGHGHLGSFVATELQQGHDVTITYTHSRHDFAREQICFNWEQAEDINLSSFDFVLVMTPPHPLIPQWIKKWVEQRTKFLFISSTSIYPQEAGEYDEKIEWKLLNKSSKVFPIEQAIRRYLSSSYVLRCGGLYSQLRHPATFLATKDVVMGAKSPVNVVHCQKVAKVIRRVIEESSSEKVINLVESHYTLKKDFYAKEIQKRGLPMPEWQEEGASARFIVSLYADKYQL